MPPVWPKFALSIALLLGLTMTALVVVQLWSADLVAFAFVPRAAFIAPPPLPAGAYLSDLLWLARPGPSGRQRQGDASGLVPDGWHEPASKSSRAAVFFVPATTSYSSQHWNDGLDRRDDSKRDRLFLGIMASPFNRGQVWAPLYRQAVIGAFLSPSPATRAAIDVAYGDVRQAFDAFVAAKPQDRPIVLAGHGQGALLLLRLLRERVAGRALSARIVAVYAIGWPISHDHPERDLGMPACTGPAGTGCLMSWTTFAEPAETMQLEAALRSAPLIGDTAPQPPYLCTNPLNGGAGPVAPASANIGTLLPNAKMTGGRIVAGLVSARCDARGLLLIGHPLDLGGYGLRGNNESMYDMALFWCNLRADVARREAAWYAKSGQRPHDPERRSPHG